MEWLQALWKIIAVYGSSREVFRALAEALNWIAAENQQNGAKRLRNSKSKGSRKGKGRGKGKEKTKGGEETPADDSDSGSASDSAEELLSTLSGTTVGSMVRRGGSRIAVVETTRAPARPVDQTQSSPVTRKFLPESPEEDAQAATPSAGGEGVSDGDETWAYTLLIAEALTPEDVQQRFKEIRDMKLRDFTYTQIARVRRGDAAAFLPDLSLPEGGASELTEILGVHARIAASSPVTLVRAITVVVWRCGALPILLSGFVGATLCPIFSLPAPWAQISWLAVGSGRRSHKQ